MNRACPSTSRLGRACCGLADTVDPTTQMKHERNTELRVHSAVMETSLEIVFTWTGVVLVLMYNVSADGADLAQKIQQADPTRPPRGY